MLYFKDILLSAVHIPGLNNSRVALSLRHFNDRIEVSPSCRFCVANSLTSWVFLIPRGPVHARRDNIPCSLMITPLWPSPVMVPDNVRNVNHLPDPASQMAEPTTSASQKIIYFHYEINSS